MKLDPCTVTFAGVALTEEPHGVAGQTAAGQAVVDAFAPVKAAAISAHAKGGASMPFTFQVVRRFDSPAAAGRFARNHFSTLLAATTGRGNLDFVTTLGTDRMAGAALQSARTSGPFEHNKVIVEYTFIGPPFAPVA